MYSFLKPLLKVVGYVPPEKEERVKMRVIPHSRIYFDIGTPFYKAQYKKWGIWCNFKEAFDFFEHCPGLSNPFSSKTSRDFDKLVEFCKQFKTFKDIDDYHKADKMRYQQAEQKYQQILKNDELAKKNSFRYWASE